MIHKTREANLEYSEAEWQKFEESEANYIQMVLVGQKTNSRSYVSTLSFNRFIDSNIQIPMKVTCFEAFGGRVCGNFDHFYYKY